MKCKHMHPHMYSSVAVGKSYKQATKNQPESLVLKS